MNEKVPEPGGESGIGAPGTGNVPYRLMLVSEHLVVGESSTADKRLVDNPACQVVSFSLVEVSNLPGRNSRKLCTVGKIPQSTARLRLPMGVG